MCVNSNDYFVAKMWVLGYMVALEKNRVCEWYRSSTCLAGVRISNDGLQEINIALFCSELHVLAIHFFKLHVYLTSTFIGFLFLEALLSNEWRQLVVTYVRWISCCQPFPLDLATSLQLRRLQLTFTIKHLLWTPLTSTWTSRKQTCMQSHQWVTSRTLLQQWQHRKRRRKWRSTPLWFSPIAR